MKWSSVAAALLACALGSAADAAVIVTGTRVIYPSDSRDVVVRLNNTGDAPALVQSWVDDGNQTAKPEALDVPFSVSPSIFRIEPGKTQLMRLVFLGADLPKDRESVYWLSVLEIPPKPAHAAEENYLQFAIKSRLKVFYRPTSLKALPQDSVKALKWTRGASGADAVEVRVENPGPFYVSFAEVRVRLADGKELAPVNGMVAPFSSETFKFKPQTGTTAAPATVQFKNVDDYGAFNDGTADLR